MNHEILNDILNRKKIERKISNDLIEFERNKKNATISRGFYIYGNPGIGKTTFVKNVLERLNYDIIWYNASDVRNKNFIETINTSHVGDRSVLSLFKKNKKKMIIVMDEIDGMNSNDKGGLSSLIKLIRPKKTKKQKIEDSTVLPILCIGNYHIDKKIKELIKISSHYEIKQPTSLEMRTLVDYLMPELDTILVEYITSYVSGDLKKVNTIYKIYRENKDIITPNLIKTILKPKINNAYVKDITKTLLNNYIPLEKHNILINETDRTIVSLLYHENIVDVIHKYCEFQPLSLVNSGDDGDDGDGTSNIKRTKLRNEDFNKIDVYMNILERLCYFDYIDRITFQKQIWVFNEISSLIKLMANNNFMFERTKLKRKYNPKELRFTKILTKYSTEYNNMLFIQSLCQKMQMDKKDMICHFNYLKNEYTENEIIDNGILSHLEISKLDIQRLYRLISDKN